MVLRIGVWIGLWLSCEWAAWAGAQDTAAAAIDAHGVVSGHQEPKAALERDAEESHERLSTASGVPDSIHRHTRAGKPRPPRVLRLESPDVAAPWPTKSISAEGDSLLEAASTQASAEGLGVAAAVTRTDANRSKNWTAAGLLHAVPFVDGLSAMVARPLLDLAAGFRASVGDAPPSKEEEEEAAAARTSCGMKKLKRALRIVSDQRWKLSEAEEDLNCVIDLPAWLNKIPSYTYCSSSEAEAVFAMAEQQIEKLLKRSKQALEELVLSLEQSKGCRIAKFDGWDRGWKELEKNQANRGGHSACPCVGVTVGDKQPRIHGKVAENANYLPNVGYDCRTWDNGHYPGACAEGWDMPGRDREWCAEKWCYVDLCECSLPTPPKISSFYPGEKYAGRSLYYSYETCQGIDDSVNTSLYKPTDPRCNSGKSANGEDEDDSDDIVNPAGKPPPVVPTETGLFEHGLDSKMCQGCEEVFYRMDGSDAWALVLKLSKDQFCFNSTKWTDSMGFKHDKFKSALAPGSKEYDSKSYAFHRLQGVQELRFENAPAKKAVTVRFASQSTPDTLITTNTIDFAEYPSWPDWKAVFAEDTEDSKQYDLAPVFMRAGETVANPTPPCRQGVNMQMDGCAKPCTFCFYASSGSGCPEKGNKTDDMTFGLGHNVESCNKDEQACSVDGGHRREDSNSTRILVWAKVGEEMLAEFSRTHEPSYQDVPSWESQNDLSTQDVEGAATRKMNTIIDGMEVMGSAAKQLSAVEGIDVRLVPVETGVYSHAAGSRLCDNCSDVLYKRVGTDMWALLMKLSKNDFCYHSEKWTDGIPFNAERVLDTSFPKPREYDAKSIAFHRLNGVSELVIESARSALAVARFEQASTPEVLITTNSVPFVDYPEWAAWNTALGSQANNAPMFVRAGKPLPSPPPICRLSNVNINGCGQPCMFCFVASEGVACPSAGVGDDRSTGLGNSAEGCHTDKDSCSVSTPNSGDNQVLVWGKVPEKWLLEFSKGGQGVDVGIPRMPEPRH
eukprot:TRINITY_DN18550_c0_g3_i1.p1 TRINITY_DN18550_c0_g3~~TRINITY_DN18550_c0_g3_i1.p1  ORF type:complete len:1013 (-),score=242.46 TRINITY_DN18550_c0_g3_i1:396-3434(-)